VTRHSKDGDGSAHEDLIHFVQHRLSALSEAFAESPLMQLRLATPAASITLVKTGGNKAAGSEAFPAEVRHASPRVLHEYLPDGEPGRAFDTVNAEVVGIFHAAPDLPAPGENVEPERVLGYIEALKLRTPVRSGLAGRLGGQVAEDGQAVDFGETLFVVDSGASEPVVEEPLVEIEPPRI
jgi:biotin carboxyl carrier protein